MDFSSAKCYTAWSIFEERNIHPLISMEADSSAFAEVICSGTTENIMKKRYENDVVSDTALAARQEVATQFRSSRKQLNMTQQTLADAAGTKKSNISRMESGKYNPSLDFLVKVAGCMGKQLNIHID